MSRKFKRTYSGFSRVILAEFMTEKELQEMDQKYNDAKIKRYTRAIQKAIRRI